MGMTFSGSFDLDGLLARTESALKPAAAAGLKPVFDLSQEKVPKRSTDLADSASIQEDRGGEGSAAIVYGSVYAHWVHEGVEFHHPFGGTSKFLESAMLEGKEAAMKAAAAELKDRL